MQDKHIDEKLWEILGDNFEAEPAGYFNFEQAIPQLKALITAEQLAILERLIKSSNIEILRVKKPLFWGDDVYEYEVPAVPRYIIQAEIDRIGGKNG